jgi:hypothetical protein
MSKRTIRISSSKKYPTIEDLDEIENSLNRKLDVIPEEDNEVIAPQDDSPPPSPVAVKKKAVNIRGKGKRTVYVNELDPNIIPPTVEEFMNPDHSGSKIAIIGKPGTGKSVMIKSILYEKWEIFPCVQVYSGTEDSNHAYSEFIPSTFIYNSYNAEAYMSGIKRQKAARQHLTNPWCVYIFDDVCEDEKIFNTPIIKGTYKNGRHWKMLHILSLQYALDIKPAIRTAIDGSFILRETLAKNRKTLFENYSSAIPDFDDFCTIMDTVTNDRTALYIHNRTQSNNFEECIYYYRARFDELTDLGPNFKFGCREIWESFNERYDKRYRDPIV